VITVFGFRFFHIQKKDRILQCFFAGRVQDKITEIPCRLFADLGDRVPFCTVLFLDENMSCFKQIRECEAKIKRADHTVLHDNIVDFDESEYKAVIEAANGHIKRWSVAPEVKGAEEFAKYATENGVVLSIAHSNADFETTLKAFDWGFRHVTHLYSCVSTITRRNGFRVPGILEAAYFLDDMDVEIIADGCHLPHSLLAYVAKFKQKGRISLITDAMRAAGQDVERSYLGSADDALPVIIEDGVAKLEDRTAFGGSIATADRLIRNMVQSGVSLCDAVEMMTVNPIKQMKLDVKKGVILPGYDADICVFDGDINVNTVICNGERIK